MIKNHKKTWLAAGLVVIAIIAVFAISQIYTLRKAHSTFENYYAFRGCVQLLARTDTYGMCRLASGEVLKIVEFRGKWYLDGDLPFCVSSFCF
ncbi:MAG TPA: hypothetical protein VMV71_00770 [Candidatus Paceibacterota bacterium]|nr:hypothetical protein [Candidatus Paceibacterota bacterium]